MKSFCIKTQNNHIVNYLLKSLDAICDMENIHYIHRSFKIYENIILHYTGEAVNSFCARISDLLADTVMHFYEPVLIHNNLRYNYFYFDDFEKKEIEQNCHRWIASNSLENASIAFRKEEISSEFLFYILENRSVILDGFVQFRLANYLKTIDEIVEYGVNQYIVEKEYKEFVDLLKLYIDSKQPEMKLVHLIYTNGESILLDENKNIISLSKYSFEAKYLSDISFSSNDYALNSLLSLIPHQIEVHLIGEEDDFITTLKLIFGTRISICRDCNLCRTYRILNNVSHK